MCMYQLITHSLTHSLTLQPQQPQPIPSCSLRSGAFPLARFLERQQPPGPGNGGGGGGINGVADLGDPRVRLASHLDVALVRAVGGGVMLRQGEAYWARCLEVREGGKGPKGKGGVCVWARLLWW